MGSNRHRKLFFQLTFLLAPVIGDPRFFLKLLTTLVPRIAGWGVSAPNTPPPPPQGLLQPLGWHKTPLTDALSTLKMVRSVFCYLRANLRPWHQAAEHDSSFLTCLPATGLHCSWCALRWRKTVGLREWGKGRAWGRSCPVPAASSTLPSLFVDRKTPLLQAQYLCICMPQDHFVSPVCFSLVLVLTWIKRLNQKAYKLF